VAKTVFCVLVFGSYVSILVRGLKKFERRKLAVVGEAEDGGEDRVFLLIVLFAFVGTLWVLGE
jgi:hypothetical protein